MVITQTKLQNAVIVTLSGRLDFNARHEFQSGMEKAKESGSSLIVLDMKDVSFIDSAALGLITVAYKNMEVENVCMVIAHAQDYVQKIFSLANLQNIIKIFPSVDDAVSSGVSVESSRLGS